MKGRLLRVVAGRWRRPPWDLPGRGVGERYVVLVREGDVSLVDALAPLGPLPVVVAPGRVAGDLGEALAARWGVELSVEPALEAPDPSAAIEPGWRRRVVDAVAGLAVDTLVVAGVDVIGVVVRAAVGEGGGPVEPRPGSRTIVKLGPGGPRVLRIGERAG